MGQLPHDPRDANPDVARDIPTASARHRQNNREHSHAKVSKDSATRTDDFGVAVDRTEDLDGYTVKFVTIRGTGRIPAYGNQRTAWDDGEPFDWENPEYRRGFPVARSGLKERPKVSERSDTRSAL